MTTIMLLVISGLAFYLMDRTRPKLHSEALRAKDIFSIENVEWNLILVNQGNPLPEAFSIQFTELSNGQRVDSRIYPELQAMFDAARASGIYPFVRDGYRTHEEQIELFEDKVMSFMQDGYNRKKAEKLAKDWVAIPGTSEHELGLAVDINAERVLSENADVYLWLQEHAWEYGFILRYPKGKEDVTGIDYEPWHYRYVGKDAAKEIIENEITLEEYHKERRRKP